MSKHNRLIKDSLFTDLFSNEQDGKRNFLSLYNSLHGTNLKYEETKIENKTIPQSVYKTFRNDVSMLINGKLIVMIEHQSTINENMPFRLLEYVTRIYEGMVPAKERYMKRLIKIPTPEFYVFYNGTDSYPNEKILKLSDAFIEPEQIQLELLVRVLNIGPGKTLKFQNSCDILKQYCNFIELVRTKVVPNDAASYKAVIQESISKGILKDYLIKNAQEVINMLLAEYDYETDIAVQRQEALEEGKELGLEQKSVEAAVMLVKDFNVAPETACNKIGAPLEKVLAVLSSTEN